VAFGLTGFTAVNQCSKAIERDGIILSRSFFEEGRRSDGRECAGRSAFVRVIRKGSLLRRCRACYYALAIDDFYLSQRDAYAEARGLEWLGSGYFFI